MEHWGIYVAYVWMATIVYAFADAVHAIRKGPQPQPQPLEPHSQTKFRTPDMVCQKGVRFFLQDRGFATA